MSIDTLLPLEEYVKNYIEEFDSEAARAFLEEIEERINERCKEAIL